MALETKEEVLAFLEATRQMLAGKVGFKHISGQYAEVITFIERTVEENERLKEALADACNLSGTPGAYGGTLHV